jgi:Fe-S-cluster-containing hydrogenase component 2
MPKKTVAVDYQICDPEQCENSICLAVLECERKVLFQEAPHEMPDVKAFMCLSCALCVQACPKGAIHVL